MKAFFSENKKRIFKLMLTHLAMTIFGMMVFIPFNKDDMSMKAFLIIGSAVAILLYMFLIDVDMWYVGAEDKLRVDAGRQKRNAGKGFLIGLFAELPSIVIGVVYAVISMLYAYYQAYPAGSALAGAKIVSWCVTFIWNGMYLGIERTLIGGGVPLVYLLAPLIPIAVSGLTYWLGLIDSPFLKPPARHKNQN